MKAVDGALGELRDQLRSRPASSLNLEGADEATQRTRKRFERLGGEVSNLFGERVAEPWKRLRHDAESHARRWASEAPKRSDWTAATVTAACQANAGPRGENRRRDEDVVLAAIAGRGRLGHGGVDQARGPLIHSAASVVSSVSRDDVQQRPGRPARYLVARCPQVAHQVAR